MYDATRKLLIINALGVFRITETITLILLKCLIYNYLHVAIHCVVLKKVYQKK